MQSLADEILNLPLIEGPKECWRYLKGSEIRDAAAQLAVKREAEHAAELAKYTAILKEHGIHQSPVGLTALACSYAILKHERETLQAEITRLRAVVREETTVAIWRERREVGNQAPICGGGVRQMNIDSITPDAQLATLRRIAETMEEANS